MERIKEEDKTEFQDFLKESQSFYELGYNEAWKDTIFESGDQWDEEEVSRRGNSRPSLTSNEVRKHVDAITNPYLKFPYTVNAIGKDGDIFNKPIQKILDESINSASGREACQRAWRSSVVCGYGSAKVYTDYESPRSNVQKVFISSPVDFRTVLRSPYSTSVDGSDNTISVCMELLPKQSVKDQYGEEVSESTSNWDDCIYSSLTEPDESVPEVVIYKLVPETIKRTFLADGSYKDEEDPQGEAREVTINKLRVVKLIGEFVLFDETYDTEYVPEVPFYGDDKISQQQAYKTGVTSKIKDLQKLYNYTLSSEAELVSSAPKSPIIAEMRSIANYKKMYESANVKNWAFLPYDSTTENGQPVPPPARMDNTAQTQNLTMLRHSIGDSMTKTLGSAGVAMGDMEVAQQSGKAINLLTQSSEVSQANYVDNNEKSIRQLAKVCVASWLTANNYTVEVEKDGQTLRVDLRSMNITADDFDFDLSNGPANESNKQNQLNFMAMVGQYSPQHIPDMIDVIAELQGVDPKLQERAKKLINPSLRDDEDIEQDPQLLMQQLDQAMQEHQMKDQEIQQLEMMVNRLANVIQADSADREAKMQQTAMQEQNKILLKEMDIEGKKEVEAMKQGNENARTVAEMENEGQKRIEDQIIQQKKDEEALLKEVINRRTNVSANLGTQRL